MTPKGLDITKFTVTILLIAIIYAVSFPIRKSTKESLGYPKDSLLNFTEITSKYGYPSAEHTVLTEDGYLLTIFRIEHGKNCHGKKQRIPVLLMHGLLESSDTWIAAGTSSGLAYLISDACHDLWVGNSRGNYYSRRHVTLDPDRDAQFWMFSVDEMGRFDIPATIEYILNYTRTDKLNYIGFSQGAGIYFIMCSERPEYCNKSNVMISLAPATRQLYTRSKPYRLLTQTFSQGEKAFHMSGMEEVLSKGSPVQEFLAFFCRLSAAQPLCTLGQALLDSYHPGSISNETARSLYGHFPAGTSLQNMARYGQSMNSDSFIKYDYGREKNMQVYNSATPPKYNLNAVTTPVVIIYGNNDGLVDVKDIKWLVGELPNVIDVVKVKDPQWNHLDVAYSQYNAELLFPKINEHLLGVNLR